MNLIWIHIVSDANISDNTISYRVIYMRFIFDACLLIRWKNLGNRNHLFRFPQGIILFHFRVNTNAELLVFQGLNPVIYISFLFHFVVSWRLMNRFWRVKLECEQHETKDVFSVHVLAFMIMIFRTHKRF